MNSISAFIAAILLYISFVFLLTGTILHLRRWKSAPVATVFMPLFPDDTRGPIKTLLDALFLPGAFKTNKFIWLVAFFMHLAGPLIIISHLRLIVDPTKIPAFVSYGIDILVLLLIPSLVLFFIRKLKKPYTSICVPDDYLLIILFILATITGTFLHFGDSSSQQFHREYFQFLLMFGSVLGSEKEVCQVGLPLIIHLLSVSLLFIYLPFSNFIYFVTGSLLSFSVRRAA